MVQKYFWRLRKLFPRSRKNSLWREILWKSRNIWKDRENFFIGQTIFFSGWEVFGRLRINFVDREISCRSRNFFVDREISCRSRNYLSIENFSINRQIGKRVPISVRRRSSPGRQVETDDVSLSELIGYQIYPHKWNFCTISISRGWSPKPCVAFSIFLLVALQSFCQVRLSKFYRYALRLETIAGDQILDRQKGFSIGKKVLDRQN